MYNNTIGKMYRPIRFLNLKEKQGLEVTNKFKSNFGDVNKFKNEIFIDIENKSIHIDFLELEIPVIVSASVEKEPKDDFINETTVLRPINISSSSSLIAEYPIVCNDQDIDLLELEIRPILVNTDALKEKYKLKNSTSDEALLVTVKSSRTRILVSSDSGTIHL